MLIPIVTEAITTMTQAQDDPWRPIGAADPAAEGLAWNGVQRGEAFYEDGAWHWMNGHDIDPPPTHWMAMPPPPGAPR